MFKTLMQVSRLRSMLTLLRARIATDEHGATAIEYALIASGVGAAVAATVWSLGSATQSLYATLAAMF
jgi:pilus assembly protein Flp/PilA